MRSLNLGNKLLYALTIPISLLLCLACLIYFTGISQWPLLGIVSIITPLIFLFNILLCCYWLFKRRKTFIFNLIPIILSLLVFGPFYKFESVSRKITRDELSIMSFNAREFNRYQQIKIPDLDVQIIEMVKNHDPDIVCFQEFDLESAPDLDIYPHQYVNHIFSDESKVIQAIFSKYPIEAKGTVNFPDSANNVIYADVEYKGELIRVYNVHLQSFKITPSFKKILAEPGEQFFGRIRNTFLKQEQQAEIIRDHLESTSFPAIICADLNNTPNSNVYRRVRGDLKDSYNEQGSGQGTTFRLFRYPLRIDYILTHPSIEILDHQILELNLSDHYPVMASVRFEAD